MKDKEKEIKYLIYLEAEKIRLAKVAIRKLKIDLQNVQNEKGYGRIRRRWN